MIIWSGWGILVPLYVVLAFALCAVGVSAVGLPDPSGPAIGCALAGVLSGAAIFLTVRKLDGREGRALTDDKTGQRVVLKPSAGSFFFIPTRYWSYILAAAGLFLGGMMAVSG